MTTSGTPARRSRAKRRYRFWRLARANFYDLLLLLRESWVVLAAFALLALALVALASWHFADANYRDDEIRTTHAGMTMTVSEVLVWMSVDIHPPLWRVTATEWVRAFGPDEHVARHSGG